MRKWMLGVCLTMALLLVACSALAAGVTIRTFTPFADIDAAAQDYMDLITAWEAETGNVVEDYSGLADESWLSMMRGMVASGEADVLVVPQGTGLTADELVTVEELQQAVPDLAVRRFESLAGEDGSVLLSPLRVNWEALYINTDVLAQKGLAVPGTYEELLSVCSALMGSGVVPIANALCEWPEIVLDCAALAGSAPEAFGTKASLDGAQQMLSTLCAVSAFGPDAFNASDAAMLEAFLAGEAAMRIDMDTLAHEIPAERVNDVIVLPMPQPAGQAHSVLVGTPTLGVAITRACWEDDDRCEAALSLVRCLLSEEGYTRLVVGVGGTLGQSISGMLRAGTDCAGVLYDRIDTDFDTWAESVVASLMNK